MANARRRVVLAAIVTAHAGALAAAMADARRPWPHLAHAAALGVVFAQVSLVCLWAVLGPGRWYLRGAAILGLCAAVAVWALTQGATLPAAEKLIYSQVVIFLACMVAGMAALVRWRGTRLGLPEGPLGQFQEVDLRFTIGDWLGLVIAAAVLCTLGRALRPENLSGKAAIFSTLAALAFLGLVLGAIALLAAGCSLRATPWWARLVALAVVCPALGALPPLFTDGTAGDFLGWQVIAVVQTAAVALSLGALRWCGYRLLRR